MQVSVEAISALERCLTITVPSERVKTEIKTRIEKAAKTVKIDGFRQGKVPLSEVQRRHGAAIAHEVLGELMRETYMQAVQQEEIQPAGTPKMETVNPEGKPPSGDNDFEFKATVEVYPEIKLGDLSKISVERFVSDVTDADVDGMIETLRKQNTEWKDASRAAKNEDRVTIDFEGSVGGELFDGGAAQNQALILGSKSMIPGFESSLEGVNADEEKTIDVTFPEEYQEENLAGKAAQFKVKVHKVEEPVLPELNEAFFAKFDIKSGSKEEFTTQIRGSMERELAHNIQQKVKDQVMDGLLAITDFEVPSSLVEKEVEAMRYQAMSRFGGDVSTMDPSSLPAELFQDEAQRRISLGLVMAEAIKANELKADEDSVRAKVESMAASYQNPQEVVDHYFNNREQLRQVEHVVIEDKVVEHILQSAKVSEKTCSYEDAMKPLNKEEAK